MTRGTKSLSNPRKEPGRRSGIEKEGLTGGDGGGQKRTDRGRVWTSDLVPQVEIGMLDLI